MFLGWIDSRSKAMPIRFPTSDIDEQIIQEERQTILKEQRKREREAESVDIGSKKLKGSGKMDVKEADISNMHHKCLKIIAQLNPNRPRPDTGPHTITDSSGCTWRRCLLPGQLVPGEDLAYASKFARFTRYWEVEGPWQSGNGRYLQNISVNDDHGEASNYWRNTFEGLEEELSPLQKPFVIRTRKEKKKLVENFIEEVWAYSPDSYINSKRMQQLSAKVDEQDTFDGIHLHPSGWITDIAYDRVQTLQKDLIVRKGDVMAPSCRWKEVPSSGQMEVIGNLVSAYEMLLRRGNTEMNILYPVLESFAVLHGALLKNRHETYGRHNAWMYERGESYTTAMIQLQLQLFADWFYRLKVLPFDGWKRYAEKNLGWVLGVLVEVVQSWREWSCNLRTMVSKWRLSVKTWTDDNGIGLLVFPIHNFENSYLGLGEPDEYTIDPDDDEDFTMEHQIDTETGIDEDVMTGEPGVFTERCMEFRRKVGPIGGIAYLDDPAQGQHPLHGIYPIMHAPLFI